MNRKLRVLLVDDQTLIRDGIARLLQISNEVDVVGQCSDGSQVIPRLGQGDVDVVLLDLSMPVMDGISVLTQAKKLNVAIPMLVLTTFDDHELVLDSVKQGAKGFLLKDVSLETLIEAIQTVARGGSFFQPAITAKITQQTIEKKQGYAAPTSIEALSEKEMEVLRLMAGGYSNREIADALHKGEGTIKNHVSNVLAKMGVRDRTRAVLLAIEQGLIK